MSKLSFLAHDEPDYLVNDDPEGLVCPVCGGRGEVDVPEDHLGQDTLICPSCGGYGAVERVNEPDEEIYHTSDRPSTVREQYEAAWCVKQSLR